jgi:hypothetical protein
LEEQIVYQFTSGIKGFDEAIQGLIEGDNVVFNVDSIDDYICFVKPFSIRTIEEEHPLVYFRFANHEYLLPKDNNAIVFNLKPEEGFEPFITKILDIIEKYGEGTSYIFDCLSDLAADWYSDKMLANFFMLTCPYLYIKKTVTYFALLRNKHGTDTVKSIQKTAQVILDVYRYQDSIYLHPIKVFQRHSPSIYLLHKWIEDDFATVNSSATIAGILTEQTQPWLDLTSEMQDLWSRTFNRANHLDGLSDDLKDHEEADRLYKQLIRMAITRDAQLINLAEKYFTLTDVLNIGKRLIGTGLIGGKSFGMLMAQNILRKTSPEKWNSKLEMHDSFFIGSDVYYSFLVSNKCWWLSREIKMGDISNAEILREKLLNGSFPEKVVNQFRKMLEYYGQSPIIVRSSSLLEDAYGNSFSGKYESFFLVNQGTPIERLTMFMDAIRKVYASTMSEQALKYRIKRGMLEGKDEQMAILVQRVSGTNYDRFFYPHVAGVGYSYNPFVWNEKIDPESGLIRIVFGLGTRAVDKVDDDYTRIASLNAPGLLPEHSKDLNYCMQRRVDVLDLHDNDFISLYFDDLVKDTSKLPLEVFTSRNEDILDFSSDFNITASCSYSLSFDKLLNNTEFCNDFKEILQTVQKSYDNPVDIEFTANFYEEGGKYDFKINLLQCRPFQFKKMSKKIETPDNILKENLIFETKGPIIGHNLSTSIDTIIYIVPEEYGKMTMSDRYAVARLVGKLNHLEDSSEKTTMLINPGRCGTTSPSLGLPVKFSEINNISIIVEVAEMHEHLIPDVSLGTHFFNDLVESDMLYMAIHPFKKQDCLNKKLLYEKINYLPYLIPEAERFQHVLKVISPFDTKSDEKVRIDADCFKQIGMCYVF